MNILLDCPLPFSHSLCVDHSRSLHSVLSATPVLMPLMVCPALPCHLAVLQSKLASLAAEAQVAQAAATSSFEWRGLKCSLPLEKLRVPLHNAKELAATLGSAMDTGRGGAAGCASYANV